MDFSFMGPLSIETKQDGRKFHRETLVEGGAEAWERAKFAQGLEHWLGADLSVRFFLIFGHS
jgi:hypothetical protein